MRGEGPWGSVLDTLNLRCLLGTQVISLVGWRHPLEELQDNMRVAYFFFFFLRNRAISSLSLYKDLKSFRK